MLSGVVVVMFCLYLLVSAFYFSVCKSCIVKYLHHNVTCPKCGGVIHQSHPLNYIRYDGMHTHIDTYTHACIDTPTDTE